MELKIEYVDINTIKPYERNAKEHPDWQIKQIIESIEQFGMNDPIAVDKHNTIIEGHGRYLACREMGNNIVPIIHLDDLTDEQRKAYTLIHNKLTMNSGFDIDILKDELADIETIDMDVFGFNDEGLDGKNDDKEDAEDDNYEEPVPVEAKSKRGQIYKLGEHRLMCGDSTREEDVQKLMDGELADLVITDPPYNVNYMENFLRKQIAIKHYKPETSKIVARDIQNDEKSDEDFLTFLNEVFINLDKALAPGGAFYIWYSDTAAYEFEKALKDIGFEVREHILWNKSAMVLGMQDYQHKHEPCLYGWKKGAPHYFIDERNWTTVFEDKDFNIDKLNKEEAINLLKQIYEYTTVLDEKRPQINDLHPTMKPVPLFNRIMKNSSRKGELVLDLFGGSGTTLITAEQIGRRCNMMEYDPRYVDVIIDRWEKLTGQTAELIDDGEGYKE